MMLNILIKNRNKKIFLDLIYILVIKIYFSLLVFFYLFKIIKEKMNKLYNSRKLL